MSDATLSLRRQMEFELETRWPGDVFFIVECGICYSCERSGFWIHHFKKDGHKEVGCSNKNCMPYE